MKINEPKKSTKLKKDQKGYSLTHQGRVIVNGLTTEDVFSIIPKINKADAKKVLKGKTLSVKDI
jgi:hypothetical protein